MVTYLSTNIGILRFEFDQLLADLGYACLILLTSFIGWSSVSRVVTAGISAASLRVCFLYLCIKVGKNDQFKGIFCISLYKSREE